jgi:hypothetical protein
VPAELELGLHPLLVGERPQLLDPADVGRGEGREAEILERLAVEEGERRAEQLRALAWPAPRRVRDEPLDAVEIDLVFPDDEDVAVTAGPDPVRAERLAKARDVPLHRVACRRRRAFLPERLDRLVDRHELPGAEEQQREERPALCLRRRRVAPLDAHPERPQKLEVHDSAVLQRRRVSRAARQWRVSAMRDGAAVK